MKTNAYTIALPGALAPGAILGAYDLSREPLATRRTGANAAGEWRLEVGGRSCGFLGAVQLPEFPDAEFFADNDGAGYAPSGKPVDFVRDAGRTRLAELRALARQLAPPAATLNRMDAAEAALAKPALADPIAFLSNLAWAAEELVEVEMAAQLARTPRRPFLLGICLKGFHGADDRLRKPFAATMNYVTVPLTWGIVEPEFGRPHYEALDELVDWAKANGMHIKGHALLWPSQWEPNVWGRVDYATLRDRALARTEEILNRYGQALDTVELINEPVTSPHWRRRLGVTCAQTLDLVVAVHARCRAIAPHVASMISITREDELWFAQRNLDDPAERDLPTTRAFCEECRRQGVRLDLVGLQYHYPRSLYWARQWIQHWHRALRCPVQITEIALPSSPAIPAHRVDNRPALPPAGGWRGRPWSESLHAEYLEKFVTLYYSLPEVTAATYWESADIATLWADYLVGTRNAKYRLPWMANAGLLDADLTPKPGLLKLRELSRSWGLKHTEMSP